MSTAHEKRFFCDCEKNWESFWFAATFKLHHISRITIRLLPYDKHQPDTGSEDFQQHRDETFGADDHFSLLQSKGRNLSVF